MATKKSTIVSTNLAAHEAGTAEHPKRNLRETFIILGGRPYEATRTNPIESRDTRTGDFQQITRLYNKDRAAVRWAKDEGCARSIDWLVSIDPKMDVVLRLEGAQKNLKDGTGGSVEERAEVEAWKNELKNYAERVFKHPVREDNAMIEHERSGPRKATFKVKRTRSDINLERCHLVLACWATCQRLLLTPCHLNPFQDFARTACEELHKAIHEKVPSHSLKNILLEGGEETIDIPSLHALVPHASANGVRSTVKGCPTLEQEIRATWVKGMVSRRSYCCESHLGMENLLLGKEGKDVLWKSLRIRTHHPHHSMHSACNSQPNLITEVDETDGRWARMQEVLRRERLHLAGLRACMKYLDKPNPRLDMIIPLVEMQPKPKVMHEGKSFIVIGWFPGGLMEPLEACMWYFEENQLLPALRRQIQHLRGWRQYISLKSVQGFGVYNCDLKHRCHTHYQCSPSEKAILAQFYCAYTRKDIAGYAVNKEESEEWADWVQLNLNNNDNSAGDRLLTLPFQTHRSLKLIVKWSRVRLTIAACVPLTLSFGIGLWYMLKYDDVEAAWAVGSYIVTAGAFIVALLAVLSTLQDGGADAGWESKTHPKTASSTNAPSTDAPITDDVRNAV